MTNRSHARTTQGAAMAIAGLVAISASTHGNRPVVAFRHDTAAASGLSAQADVKARQVTGKAVQVAEIDPQFEHHYP